MILKVKVEDLPRYAKKLLTWIVLLSGFWFSTIRPTINGAIKKVVKEEIMFTNMLLFQIADSAQVAEATRIYIEMRGRNEY